MKSGLIWTKKRLKSRQMFRSVSNIGHLYFIYGRPFIINTGGGGGGWYEMCLWGGVSDISEQIF